MASAGRTLDLVGQILCVLLVFFLVALLTHEQLLAGEKISEISANKAVSFLLLGWHPVTRSGARASSSFLCRLNLWWIACKTEEDQGCFNKAACRISCFANRELIHVPLAGHGGEGRKWSFCLARWFLLHHGAPHAVVFLTAAIHGQEDGRSSTSTSEAFSIQRQCSATRRSQVVRPRLCLVCWWLRLLAGRESPSVLSSDDLGVVAWRSPARIIAESAHSAYDKAAQYFNIKVRRVPVNKEFLADVKGFRRCINGNTIMMVGSAPGFPHGLIDPIEELGELASQYGICLHVDLCLGGFVLPFARKLGYPIPPFDFSVKGVTSISTDVHKYGLAPKGTSTVLYRNHEIRKHQFVAVTEWTGGLYVSPTMAGSRPGGLIAGAWAAMMSLGLKGYLESTGQIMEVSKKIQKGIDDIPGLFVIGKPDMTVVAFGSDAVDIFEVNDIMASKGWHLNALQRPNSLHICVTLQHTAIYMEFVQDLKDSVNTVKANPGPISGGMAPIYGAAGKMPDRGTVKELLVEFMDSSC